MRTKLMILITGENDPIKTFFFVIIIKIYLKMTAHQRNFDKTVCQQNNSSGVCVLWLLST